MKHCPKCGVPLHDEICANCGTNTAELSPTGTEQNQPSDAPVTVSPVPAEETQTESTSASTPLDNTESSDSSVKIIINVSVPKWIKNLLAWCSKACKATGRFICKYPKRVALLTVALALGIVAIVHLSNIFRPGRVDNVDLGFTMEQVEKKLGKPDESGDYSWDYYSGKYGKIMRQIEKLEAEGEEMMESASNMDELFEKALELDAKIEKLEEKLETIRYDHISVSFDGDGLVSSVVFEKNCIDSPNSSEDPEEIDREEKKIKFLPKELNKYSTPSEIKYSARVYYKGGEYRMDYVQLDDSNDLMSSDLESLKIGVHSVTFKNSWGTYSSEITISDAIEKGMVLHSDLGPGISCTMTALNSAKSGKKPDFDMVIEGTGSLSAADIANNLKSGMKTLVPFVVSVSVKDGITDLVGDVFAGFYSLSSLTLNNTLQSISEEVITSELLPAGPLYSGNTFFRYIGTAPAIFEIKEDTETIAPGAFAGQTNLSVVTLPNSITSIGDEAFIHCTSLTSVNIPTGVAYIGTSAFKNCIGLTSVTIPNGVTSIGDDTFYHCTSLISITIPDSVTSIGNEAFYKCINLAEVTISNKVTDIGSYAFAGCSKLSSVIIPDSVTSIGSFAFCDCSTLASIVFADTSTWYRTDNRTNWSDKTGGTAVSVTNAADNAKDFVSASYHCHWYKL